MRKGYLTIVFVMLSTGMFAQNAATPLGDYSSEPSKINIIGVAPGMTAKDAVSSVNIAAIPLFSGFSTPVQANRSGDDKSGFYRAEYGPSMGTNHFGQPVASISLTVSWVDDRVTTIELLNYTKTYDDLRSILVSTYGKPDRTSDVSHDLGLDELRYDEWHRNANIATDVVRLTSHAGYNEWQRYTEVAITRRPTRLFLDELKARDNWATDFSAAAADADPGRAYLSLAARQYSLGNCVRALPACDKSIAANPAPADAYYLKAMCLVVQGEESKGRSWYPPATEDTLKKYLQLAPTGPQADEVKDLLEILAKQKKP